MADKETRLQASQERRQAVAAAEVRRQRQLRTATSVGAGGLLLLAAGLYYAFRRAERLKRVDPETLRMLLDHTTMAGYDMGALLARVSCPTLIIQSDPTRDSVLTDDDAAFARWHLRQCQQVRLADVGHNLHADAPDIVIKLLETFSREVTGLGVL